MTLMAANSNCSANTDNNAAEERQCNSVKGCSTDAKHPTGQKDAPAQDDPPSIQSVEEFKNLMYKMQSVRRSIVSAILQGNNLQPEWIEELNAVFASLTDSNTRFFMREMTTQCANLSINVKDEITGLKKDLEFIERVQSLREGNKEAPWPRILSEVDIVSILAPYHPVSAEAFRKEFDFAVKFLRDFAESNTNGVKPILVTDWDGTMKDYCSQYATNLQPVYSAIGMTRFAKRFTRLSAVLTAGPLRGPGILDLTAMPIDGPVLFSGSWGREWWLGGKRIVHDDGISEEGFVALQRLNDEMGELLHSSDYTQFALVGSGVQRKVDRLTLGVQTVCGHVQPELSTRYQDAVKERMHRVDPSSNVLVFDPSTELEVEVVAHNSGTVWNKADGVDRVVSTVGDSLETPGRVLICGDTTSDLPMVRQAKSRNPDGVMAIFVGLNEKLRASVREVIKDDSRCCFVSCPDVIHAALAEVLNAHCDTEE